MTSEYRLRFKEVDERAAKEAVSSGRVVICAFDLSHYEWDYFVSFFEENKRGVLIRSKMKTYEREMRLLSNDNRPLSLKDLRGHVVVLTEWDENSMRLMSSWGPEFGDDGFFRVQDSSALRAVTFWDVYWSHDDLRPSEKWHFFWDVYWSHDDLRPSEK